MTHLSCCEAMTGSMRAYGRFFFWCCNLSDRPWSMGLCTRLPACSTEPMSRQMPGITQRSVRGHPTISRDWLPGMSSRGPTSQQTESVSLKAASGPVSINEAVVTTEFPSMLDDTNITPSGFLRDPRTEEVPSYKLVSRHYIRLRLLQSEILQVHLKDVIMTISYLPNPNYLIILLTLHSIPASLLMHHQMNETLLSLVIQLMDMDHILPALSQKMISQKTRKHGILQ